jgi:hypothetical protein
MASPMDISALGSSPQAFQFIQNQIGSILSGNGYNPALFSAALDPAAEAEKKHKQKMRLLWDIGVFDDIKKTFLESLAGDDPTMQQLMEPTVAKMLGVDLKS